MISDIDDIVSATGFELNVLEYGHEKFYHSESRFCKTRIEVIK